MSGRGLTEVRRGAIHEAMPSDRPPTTIRFTDEDRRILEKLQKLTGLESSSAVIRLAIREALAARQKGRSGKR